MKTTIFSLLMAYGVTAFGQFIPQPNAYNPDANGDSFIGVDDVMGTLALFNSPFNNGDSLNTLIIEFYQGVQIHTHSSGVVDTLMCYGSGYDIDSISCQGLSPFSWPIPIPEGIDILYIDIPAEGTEAPLPWDQGMAEVLPLNNAPESIDFFLPSGPGHHAIQVFSHVGVPDEDVPYLKFFQQDSFEVRAIWSSGGNTRQQWTPLIRGIDSRWYSTPLF